MSSKINQLRIHMINSYLTHTTVKHIIFYIKCIFKHLQLQIKNDTINVYKLPTNLTVIAYFFSSL